MLRRFLPFLLRDKDSDATGGGGGGISAVEASSMDSVIDRLGLDPELKGEPAEPAAKKDDKTKAKAKGETPAQKAAREAAEAEEARIAAKAEESGKTPEEIIAEEQAEAEAEEARIAEKMEETGKTREEILAEDEAEAAAGGTEGEPEFTEEQQAWLEEQNKASAEELTKTKGELETATARVAELETELAGKTAQPVEVAQIHPLMLEDDPAKIDAYETSLRKFESWCLANWDGTEAVEAKGDQPARPAYTAAQIRQRYADVKEERETIPAAARQAIATRKKTIEVAKTKYPELFNPKRPEYKLAQNILRVAPGLKAVMPNIYVIIGDAIRGEKARLAEEKAKGAKKPAAAPAKGAAAKPVARPGAGAQAAKPAPKGKGTEVSAQRFMEMGGDRNALVAMIQGAHLPTLTATEK